MGLSTLGMTWFRQSCSPRSAICAQEFFHGLFGTVAPVAAEDQVDADDVVAGIFAGADLIAVGAGDDVDAALEAAVFGEGDGDAGLDIDGFGAAFIEQAGERGFAEEAFGDDFVVVAAEREVEAEKDVEIIDLDGAHAQVIRNLLQQQGVELEGLFNAFGIHVAGQRRRLSRVTQR